MSELREPAQLTPAERHVDALLRFENFERYTAQSKQCCHGDAAPPPARTPLTEAQGREYALCETLDGRYPSDDCYAGSRA